MAIYTCIHALCCTQIKYMHGMLTEADLYCKLPRQSHVLKSADAGRQSNPKCTGTASMTTAFALVRWQGLEQRVALNSKQSNVVHNATLRSNHGEVRCHCIGSGMITYNQMSRHDREPAIAQFVMPAPRTIEKAWQADQKLSRHEHGQ